MKVHFPTAFYTALLNNQPMGFWNAAVLTNELRRQGIPVLPVDVHLSRPKCSIEADGIRLGLNYVKRLAEAHIEAILAARAERRINLDDEAQLVTWFAQRAEISLILGDQIPLGAAHKQVRLDPGGRILAWTCEY